MADVNRNNNTEVTAVPKKEVEQKEHKHLNPVVKWSLIIGGGILLIGGGVFLLVKNGKEVPVEVVDKAVDAAVEIASAA